ncbi:hypothetical protein BU26DRAFT_311445 [Trematosphaeria pertusa]|uniref:Uncharacterized protein n=1 Tax=Trematosphaeria pertusa TaxID=390896 RepID=A0A6A6IGA4_9PLEO|nr:uncharacterized protein BU26DRAFT_311445 [Trematosphaeria pertusa]KAF2249068.1 hypothetical protein BU26DRAFT_311445 [Trematosphaeria pertusa]
MKRHQARGIAQRTMVWGPLPRPQFNHDADAALGRRIVRAYGAVRWGTCCLCAACAWGGVLQLPFPSSCPMTGESIAVIISNPQSN